MVMIHIFIFESSLSSGPRETVEWRIFPSPVIMMDKVDCHGDWRRRLFSVGSELCVPAAQ